MSSLSSKIRKTRCPKAAAVIVAAGSGTRFGGNKLYAELRDVPVLARTLAVFEDAELIHEVVLVVRGDGLQDAGQLCKDYGFSKVKVIVSGGATRALSCYAGVMAVSEEMDIIAVHDGARPLVTDKIVEDAVWAAYRFGAAVPAVPVRDTIKRAEDGFVAETPDRSALFAVQTPQCFQRNLIQAAMMDAVKNAPDITDDCMAVERIGGRVKLTKGSEENIKITTPMDLELAERIIIRRQGA